MKIAKLVLGWTLVGVPLIYGVSQTLIKVTALFG
ncbi:MFS transporter small subunit [Cryobacterium roopkundense]|uniref:Oxalate:formate antiporter n=1 Tax=Cryobacterium roopkundense TaxID=1001240 RepID=A0A7W8ZVP0_9MICO|nr:hypothetical protein [Cryobacterium roopkundense]